MEWVAQCLPELLERAVKEELSLPRFLHLVCQREQESREERRVRTGLKLSGLPGGKTLDSVDKSQIDLLATSEFVRRKEVVLLLGPRGVGKSHLAAGLGVKAVQNGFSVAFMSADHLVDVVRRDKAADGPRLHRRKYMTTSLLIIDELGFQALDRHQARNAIHTPSGGRSRSALGMIFGMRMTAPAPQRPGIVWTGPPNTCAPTPPQKAAKR